jgi:DNA-binding CsgD family transcriptional regulator
MERKNIVDSDESLPSTLKLDEQSMTAWLNTLRFLPVDPTQLLAWIDGPLKQFFGFDRLVCIHGELVAGQISVTHCLTTGFTPEQEIERSQSFDLAQRGTILKWLSDRRPFYINVETPPSHATEFEMEDIRRNDLGNIAAHGVLNVRTNAGTYFSFSGILPIATDWHLDALRLIVPVLNDLYLTYIANLARNDAQLDVLSPRQRAIVRHLVAGAENKEIAKIMGISEKTVRNQLSEIYALLKIHKRSQLQAFLR